MNVIHNIVMQFLNMNLKNKQQFKIVISHNNVYQNTQPKLPTTGVFSFPKPNKHNQSQKIYLK